MQFELLPYNPLADNKAIVVEQNFRFTVLTESIIRFEENNNQQFEDRATFAFVNRKLPIPQFTSSKSAGDVLTITTSKLKLTFDTKDLDLSQSLQIQGIGTSDLDFKDTWHYNDNNKGNLYGTIRTLDGFEPTTLNCTSIDKGQYCQFGVISKDGWSVIDDSQNFVLGDNDWWQEKNQNKHDMYFFGHGQNYKQALSEFAQIAGSVPIVPRYSLGVWWTRWFDWDNQQLQGVINNFKKYKFPMDICVIDMNWHQKNAWGGYTYDNNLFPNTKYSLDWIHQQGPMVSLNIHDDDGVHNYDSSFNDMCQALGLDPKNTTYIPFQFCSSQKYSFSLDDLVLQPLEKLGIDLWWPDWQQDPTHGGCEGQKLNPTMQSNKLRVTSPRRRNPTGPNRDIVRRINFARWGGLGNHRYQVGFSGDVPNLTWDNLAVQPYVSASAANVAFGYWSHDITAPGNNLEMYVRWIQWGSFSGIMRFHDRGGSSGGCANVFPDAAGGFPQKNCWQWTPYDTSYNVREIIRNTLDKRISLIPYLYTASRKTFQTGVSFLRALYYEYPKIEDAYTCLTIDGTMSQYMFGDDMMVAPIVSPLTPQQVVYKNIWVPPGEWVEEGSGLIFKGPLYYNRSWDLSEIPIFVKQGAIIPKRPKQNNFELSTAKQDFSKLQFDIYFSGQSNKTVKFNTIPVYEDDGQTQAYLENQYSTVNISYNTDQETFLNVNIFTEQSQIWKKNQEASQRSISLRLISSFPLTTVTYRTSGMKDPVQLSYQEFIIDEDQQGIWSYDPEEVAVIIKIPTYNENDVLDIYITGNFTNNYKLNGFKGAILKSTLAKSNTDQDRSTPGGYSQGDYNISIASSYGERLAQNADPKLASEFKKLVDQYPQIIQYAYDSFNAMKLNPRVQYSLDLLKQTFFVQ